MRVLGLAFVGIESGRPDELAEFARTVLGLEGETDGDRHVFTLPDGATLAALPYAFLADAPDTVVGLAVDDLDGALQECRDRGVELSGPVIGEPPHRYQHLRLPDGRFFALVEHPEPPGASG